MTAVYVVGRISVKEPHSWALYRSQVNATLEPWGGELLLRGRKVAALSAMDEQYSDIVAIRFPDQIAARGWFESPQYQGLIALRSSAADVVLTLYES